MKRYKKIRIRIYSVYRPKVSMSIPHLRRIKTLFEMVDYAEELGDYFMTLRTLSWRTSTHVVSASAAVVGQDKDQDFVVMGFAVDELAKQPFFYKVLIDGHGSHDFINFIRTMKKSDWDRIMRKGGSAAHNLANYVNANADLVAGRSSGGTFISWKCFDGRIMESTCGDSASFVFEDGDLVYESPVHNTTNFAERARIQEMGFGFWARHDFRIREGRLTTYPLDYITYGDYSLALTQAIGHNGVTGLKPNHAMIEIRPGHKTVVVSMSDGASGMLDRTSPVDMDLVRTSTVTDLMDTVLARWKQSWTLDQEPNYVFDSADDVSIIGLCYEPLPDLVPPLSEKKRPVYSNVSSMDPPKSVPKKGKGKEDEDPLCLIG